MNTHAIEPGDASEEGLSVRAWVAISVLAVACAPAPEPPDEVAQGPQERVPGGFYPTWEAGLRWRVGSYTVTDSIRSMVAGMPSEEPTMVGRFVDLKAERIADDGKVTLISSNVDHTYVRFSVDHAGTIVSADESLRDGLRARGQPFGHPDAPPGPSGILTWPVFPLEPGVLEAADGSWTQVVRADGDARIVAIVFDDRANGGRCPASVIQRWEPGRPFWSYRVSNGCGRAWGHGALISVEDERLVLQAGPRRITYPGTEATE